MPYVRGTHLLYGSHQLVGFALKRTTGPFGTYNTLSQWDSTSLGFTVHKQLQVAMVGCCQQAVTASK